MGRLKLETFETIETPEGAALEMSEADFEEARLAAFEKGYQAGWDDAVAAQNSEVARLVTDLGRNLQEMSFTYHEIRRHMLDALRPLLSDMTAKVLPRIAREVLPHIVAEELTPLGEQLISAPIRVLANPEALPRIEELLGQEKGLPLVFTPEPTLSEGQVQLRFSAAETHIDLDAAITAIASAIDTCFQGAQEQNHDG